MNRLTRHCLTIFLVAGFFLPLAGQADDNRIEHITTVEGISEYHLDNGLQILLMPDHSRPTTTINVTYFVGSKHESYGETGMAHLLEHMLFYGTPDHQDIKAEISERGGSANGTTWYERTNYFQNLPAGEENLEWAIRMEADRMVNSLIDEEDLASEMTVVRNEFEIGENNPFRVLMQRVMAAAYEWHGYGRSTIGARSDIENVPIERLQSFYRRYYQPDNAMVVLSGNFETDRALELIETHFGAIPAPERTGEMTLWPTYTRDPVQDGERAVTVRRSGQVQALMTAFNVPAAQHEDFAAVEVLSHLLGDMPSGRLYKALVESELASQVGSFVMRLPEPSLLMLFAQSQLDQDLDQVRSEMNAAIDALTDSPPTEEEVRRAINALQSNMERTLNDSSRVGIQLSEWAATGDWRLLFLHRDRLDEVTVDDVTRVANTYLQRDNRTVGRFIPDSDPERAEIPEAPELGPLLADYAGRDDRAAGEAFDPTPENIEERVVRFELANGAKVALLPKETRGNRVHARMNMRIGNLETLTGLGDVPGVTTSMLQRGTENHTRQEIADRIDELQSSLSIRGSQQVSVNIESQRDNLLSLLELAADMLKHPTFPESELAELTRQRLTSLDQQRDQPAAVASRMIGRHFDTYPSDHPFHTPDWDEAEARIREVTREQLVEFHHGHYGFGSGTSISFVGDFDADELREVLESLFGDWSAEVAFERIEREHVDIEPAQLKTQLDDKANAVFIARYGFPMRDDHADYPALRMAGHLIGGGFLSSRLADRVRDQEGLSYGVGGNFSAHSIDERGTFNAFAMYAPENRDRLIEVMFEEFEKVVEEGFDEDELQTGRRGWLHQMDIRRSNDGQLASMLSGNLYLDRDMHHEAEFEDRVRQLTVEDVNQAVRRHFNPEQISYATAGDFEADEDE